MERMIKDQRLDEAYSRGMRSVVQGQWGEGVAAAYLARKGWRILARDAHPCENDKRRDVDIIALVENENRIVFVEVKTHVSRSNYASRLWSVDWRKKRNLLRACSCWLYAHRWYGSYRFDVIEVYGRKEDAEPPEIDHIENVPLFPAYWRFRKGV